MDNRDCYNKDIITVEENDLKKRELMHSIISILEVLSNCECQRVLGYLSELYLS